MDGFRPCFLRVLIISYWLLSINKMKIHSLLVVLHKFDVLSEILNTFHLSIVLLAIVDAASDFLGFDVSSFGPVSIEQALSIGGDRIP